MRCQKIFIRLSLFFVLGLFLVSCSTIVKRQNFEDMSFKHLPPIVFNVARVEIVGEFKSPLLDPNVEHNFPVTPQVAIKSWLSDRVYAAGTKDFLQVTIIDASAKITELETNRDLEGWLTTEQAERVDARLEVRFDIANDSGKTGPYATAQAKRSRTLPEGASLNDRDKIYFDLTSAIMNDFNASMEQALRKYLVAYIK